MDSLTFGAFIKKAAKARVDTAIVVCAYSRKLEECPSEIRQWMRADFDAGRITEARRDMLLRCLDKCADAWKSYGRLTHPHDPSDWSSLGEGAYMRRTHTDDDYSGGIFGRRTDHRMPEEAAGAMYDTES